jgi:hypothetical protein
VVELALLDGFRKAFCTGEIGSFSGIGDAGSNVAGFAKKSKISPGIS